MHTKDEAEARAAWRSEAEAVFDEIVEAQRKAVAGFEPEVAKLVDRPFEEGKPLLAPEDITIDGASLAALLTEVVGIMQDWIGGEAILADGKLDLSAGAVRELLEASVKGGTALAEKSCDFSERPNELAVALSYALVPFVNGYARKLESKLPANETFGGRCPVCDSEPFMAELSKDEEGRRYLACSTCATRWRAARMRCPFCGNDDQQTLGSLEVETFEGYRINTCDACHRYIKTIDRRERIKPATLALADVLTPELDEIAMDRKYGLRMPANRG